MNISQFTWIWNSFWLISLVFRTVWFVSTYFSLGQLNQNSFTTSAILLKKTKRHTETCINPDRQTDRDLIVSHLRFKMSLWHPPTLFFFKVLICPRLRSQAKWAVYFRDMERVNFKLFLRQAFNKLVVFNCIYKKKLVLKHRGEFMILQAFEYRRKTWTKGNLRSLS